jgi:pimeloyl-ACP methyl ester carboxylesterase
MASITSEVIAARLRGRHVQRMKEITLPQGTIRYRDEGKGPVLLFVHGILVAGDIWDELVPELSTRYRCITPDWPLGSHTLPMNADADLTPEGIAKIIAAFVAALDLSDVTIVGNDSGGAITQLVVARHNHEGRVTRVVLTPCDAFEVFPPKLFAYLGVLSLVPAAAWVLAKAMHALPVMGRLPIAYGLGTKRPFDLRRIERWIAPAAASAGIRRDLVKFVRGVSPKVTLAVAKELPRVTLPVLLAWTPDDRNFVLSLGERLADTLPNAELVHIRDSLVFVMLDRPRELADRMRTFLARTERTERQRKDVRVSESS